MILFNKSTSTNIHRVICIILIFLFVILIVLFYISFNDIYNYETIILEKYNPSYSLENKKYKGDYLSSLMNARNIRISMIAVIVTGLGSLATFIAFITQKNANDIHRQDISGERVINNLLHLMDVHRAIVGNIKLCSTISAQSAFHLMFYEFKSIYACLINSNKDLINNKEVAIYISMQLFISGCTGENDDVSRIDIIKQHIPEHILKSINFENFINDLQKSNKSFVEERNPPLCFIIAKYKDVNIHPVLPYLYKGHLQNLTSYFKVMELYLKICNSISKIDVEQKNTIELYKEMFLSQLSIHESALLNIYFKYKKYHDEEESINLENLKKMISPISSFPSAFDIDDSSFLDHYC